MWQLFILSAFVLCGCASPKASVPPPVGQTSADCDRPVYATDMLVCGDTELRLLDDRLAVLWEARRRMPGFGDSDQTAQTVWFRQRSLCAFRPDQRSCALSSYKTRIAALQAEMSAP